MIKAAKKALETGNVNYVLSWVYKGGEKVIREAFDKTTTVRMLGKKEAIELADLWFFETVVRIHREGEGTP